MINADTSKLKFCIVSLACQMQAQPRKGWERDTELACFLSLPSSQRGHFRVLLVMRDQPANLGLLRSVLHRTLLRPVLAFLFD